MKSVLFGFLDLSFLQLPNKDALAHDPVYVDPCFANYRQLEPSDPYYQLHLIHYQLYRQEARAPGCAAQVVIIRERPALIIPRLLSNPSAPPKPPVFLRRP
jgi:hypothetical protein